MIAPIRPAALATQPATSQEGERYGKWHVMLLGLVNAIHRDGGMKTQTVGIEQSYNQALALAATPTPPTLSEDLLGKVRDVLAIYADPAGYTDNNGEQMTADNAAHPGRLAQLTLVEFDAALAQVKAS